MWGPAQALRTVAGLVHQPGGATGEGPGVGAGPATGDGAGPGDGAEPGDGAAPGAGTVPGAGDGDTPVGDSVASSPPPPPQAESATASNNGPRRESGARVVGIIFAPVRFAETVFDNATARSSLDDPRKPTTWAGPRTVGRQVLRHC